MNGINVTKMSSKGQIVIPQELRQGFKEGESFVIFRCDNRIILKKAEAFEENLKEDLEFAKRTEKAWKDIDEGKYEEYSVDEFFKKLREW